MEKPEEICRCAGAGKPVRELRHLIAYLDAKEAKRREEEQDRRNRAAQE